MNRYLCPTVSGIFQTDALNTQVLSKLWGAPVLEMQLEWRTAVAFTETALEQLLPWQ